MILSRMTNSIAILVCCGFGCVRSPRSGGYELGNAHEIVGDEIEHEPGSDGYDASVFCLAHRAVLLAPAEDALCHLSASLRDLIADVTGGARIDCAPTPLAGLGEAVVLRNVRRHVDPAQRRN